MTAFRTIILMSACATLVISEANSQTAFNENDDFVSYLLIEGTEPESDSMRRYKESQAFKDQRAADIKQARVERRAMKEQGFIIADERTVNLHAARTSNPYKQVRDDVEDRLAFQPAAFNLGLEVYGCLPDESDDGMIHDMTSLLRHPSLGNLYIRERSLSTEPTRTSKYLHGPRFDMRVNGNPALLTVYRSPDGTRGRTSLVILSKTRLTIIGAGLPLKEGGEDYELFMDVAQQL